MRKVLGLALVGCLIFGSFAAFADNAGVVGTEITFDQVVNLFELWEEWPEGSIEQGDIADIFANQGWLNIWNDPGNTHTPEIKVTVQALGKFHVYSGYWTADSLLIAPAELDDFLALYDGGTYLAAPKGLDFGPQGDLDTAYTGPQVLGPPFLEGDYAHIDPLDVTGFTDLEWVGTNNVAAGGETVTYDVLWKPQNLTGVIKAGDTFGFRIYFLVDDPAI